MIGESPSRPGYPPRVAAGADRAGQVAVAVQGQEVDRAVRFRRAARFFRTGRIPAAHGVPRAADQLQQPLAAGDAVGIDVRVPVRQALAPARRGLFGQQVVLVHADLACEPLGAVRDQQHVRAPLHDAARQGDRVQDAAHRADGACAQGAAVHDAGVQAHLAGDVRQPADSDGVVARVQLDPARAGLHGFERRRSFAQDRHGIPNTDRPVGGAHDHHRP